MKNALKYLCVIGMLGTVGLAFLGNSHSQPASTVHMIQLNDDTINPVTAEYIVQSIDRATQERAACLVIKMDTPGGLLNSTRTIVKKMLTATVPIVVYIAPSGSRAGSAGVFITYASHVAAMAPSTNIGAAHPVQMGQGKKRGEDWNELKKLIDDLKQNTQNRNDAESEAGKEEEPSQGIEGSEASEELVADENPMESKILNDTVAFIKGIAEARNRNVEWAIKSVTKSLSITADEALEKGVVEIIAKNDRELLDQLDGRTVTVNGTERTLVTKTATIENIAMDKRQIFFNILANPNIAYFLMILGFYGLLYEVTHPGFGIPGILGIIFLILAFYSLQTLPTNYAGLALMAMGLGLLIAEAFVPGFGLLTMGGLTCLVLGSMLLFESADPIMRVSKTAIFTFSFTTAGITLLLLHSALRSHRSKVISGREGLIGEIAEVRERITPDQKGKVYVHGELWSAVSNETLEKETEVRVVGVNRLILTVATQKGE